MNNVISMNPNALVAFLQKAPKEFTKEDIVKFIKAREIKMVNFM